MFQSYEENKKYLEETLGTDKNFDVVSREIEIGERRSVYFFIDGFCKDELLEKFLQYLMDKKKDDMPSHISDFAKTGLPYVEIDLEDNLDKVIQNILSGVFAFIIEGYDKIILMDSRTYPARSVSEPEKDKALRGSKDGFVETVVFNTALIRRRIRSTDLCIEMMNAGEQSKTDIAICYMDSRADHKFLSWLKDRISHLHVDALTLNQESLAECIFPARWYNPFPKFKFTERPDTAAAQILEGNIIILVDNSPSAMILPVSLFDIMEESDDYYFPPITGSYLRLSRALIVFMTYFITPTYLLLVQYPQWIPNWLKFIAIKETVNVPIIIQFLLLELAIDGLRLAAVNTPNMLSTPLSVMAALVLGEFSVKSGWFNSECMLYMAFVSIANYTQANYEFGYALKFFRIISLLTTFFFGWVGYIAGWLFFIIALINNRMVSGQSYLYPVIPFSWSKLKDRIIRHRLIYHIKK